jgi:hypothetical protein
MSLRLWRHSSAAAHAPDTLLAERGVREGVPSNVIGLLFHAAEHAARHAGQALTTAACQGGETKDE